MKAEITIRMDNAAFTPYPSFELSRILKVLSVTIQNSSQLRPGDAFPIYDINGNKVGYLTISYFL